MLILTPYDKALRELEFFDDLPFFFSHLSAVFFVVKA